MMSISTIDWLKENHQNRDSTEEKSSEALVQEYIVLKL